MYTALSIAGSDSSAGAGIQADIKTMSAHGIYAMTAITALTAQNTTGVHDIMDVTPVFLRKQLDAVFTDIYPDAVKIGMIPSYEIMETVVGALLEYRARHIVVDPVMISTSGRRLMREDTSEYMRGELFPIAELVTPNISEIEAITGIKIDDAKGMEAAGTKLYADIKDIKSKRRKLCADILASMYEIDTAVLVKGGHSIGNANDLLIHNNGTLWISGEHIDNPNTHGTGCTLSSAIASNLAKGLGIEEAVILAKKYITGAIQDGLDLGKGPGPLHHFYNGINN